MVLKPNPRFSQRKQGLIVLSFFDGLGSAPHIATTWLQDFEVRRIFAWETDGDLAKLSQERFGALLVHRGDFVADDVQALISDLDQDDPDRSCAVLVTGGPPCHDHSRIRNEAPGSAGPEGSKFLGFCEFLRSLEAAWGRAQAALVVENVVPQNKQDVRMFEQKLSATAVVADAADFGVISRPRVWWTRIQWQQLASSSSCPVRLRWSKYQGLPQVHFDVPKDDLHDYDVGELQWPENLTSGRRLLPCLTTPADNPEGRSAPRSCKGKVDSDTQARWLAHNRSLAPWHFEAGNMWKAPDGRLCLPTPSIKEQLHHLPKNYTSSLTPHQRDKALANGWHVGVARWMMALALFCGQIPASSSSTSVPQPLGPFGENALDVVCNIWQSAPLLVGPGVPLAQEAVDLSAITDSAEHWRASFGLLHPHQAPPSLEPGLAQWLPVWSHWKSVLPDLRPRVTQALKLFVDDLEEETAQWFSTLPTHVKELYQDTRGRPTLQVPAIKSLARRLGWPDYVLFDELSQGFPLLGQISPGAGWRQRSDARYSTPVPVEQFFRENDEFVCTRLRHTKVDQHWHTMATEIASDVVKGRMEGPFEAPAHWPKRTVALADFEHTRRLLPLPPGGRMAVSFAFPVHQVGADGAPKVRRAEDWRSSGANKTVSVDDTPAYHDIYAFIAVGRAIAARHPGVQLVTWGLDHEAAYRQLPAENPDHAYVILPTPAGPTLWRHRALLFGSTASVWSYCRTADCMAWLTRSLWLSPTLHFVDDYGATETSPEADSSFQEIQEGCGYLGFRFKASKAQPPSNKQTLLGVELQYFPDRAEIHPTSARVVRLRNQLEELLVCGQLRPRDAASLVGRLQFVAQSLFGQAGAAALKPFHRRAAAENHRRGGAEWPLGSALTSAIQWLVGRLQAPRPRTINFVVHDTAVIYADAFFEMGGRKWRPGDDYDIDNIVAPSTFVNGWGCVVRTKDECLYAAGTLPMWFTRHFFTRRSYIYVLEIMAQVIPLVRLADRLPRHITLFIDNEPARHALIKGFGRDDCVNKLIQWFWTFVEDHGWWPVWQRVPTSANASDAVSRFDFDHAEAEGWQRVDLTDDAFLQFVLDSIL